VATLIEGQSALPDEAELVAKARSDPRAFAPLYRHYVGPIYRYCFHALGNRADAEDATSLVFTRALAAMPRFRHQSFRSWLFAIAHNVVVDRFRRPAPTRPIRDDDDWPDPRPGPDDIAMAAQERSAVYARLAALPLEQRRVMELRLSGLGSAEIARMLGRSPGAVRSLQFRALCRLRDQLGEATIVEDQHERS
jgi:RNA polymerase sigma-70 factor (ECF subfamily)